jgi:hypothetical protein
VQALFKPDAQINYEYERLEGLVAEANYRVYIGTALNPSATFTPGSDGNYTIKPEWLKNNIRNVYERGEEVRRG